MDAGEMAELKECFLPQSAEVEEVEDVNESAERAVASFGEGGSSEIDRGVVARVEADIDRVAEAIGLNTAFEVDGGGATSASSSSVAPPAPVEEEVAALDQQPWERLSDVSPLGYVYDGGRSIMRVQRGKPAQSVTVNCYNHSQCKMLLTLNRCPDDMTLKRWYFSVPAPPPGASTEASRALGRQHMAEGLRQWGGRRR